MSDSDVHYLHSGFGWYSKDPLCDFQRPVEAPPKEGEPVEPVPALPSTSDPAQVTCAACLELLRMPELVDNQLIATIAAPLAVHASSVKGGVDIAGQPYSDPWEGAVRDAMYLVALTARTTRKFTTAMTPPPPPEEQPALKPGPKEAKTAKTTKTTKAEVPPKKKRPWLRR